MDKSWINMPRISNEYRDGITSFINFAKQSVADGDLILCPCRRCVNCHLKTCEEVENHLICNGILITYTNWYCHGENPPINEPFPQAYAGLPTCDNFSPVDEMRDLVNDVFGNHPGYQDHDGWTESPEVDSLMEEERCGSEPNKEREDFNRLMEHGNEPLYGECTTFSKLSFIIRLFHLKCLSGWSDKSFTMLLELLNEAFLEIRIPKSARETKKFLKSFDLGYEKIPACPNDCMLFRGDKENLENCEVCGTSKWSTTQTEHQQVDESSKTAKKKKFAKILRYFPLVPRLQRLFTSSKTSSSMRWHVEKRNKDGVLRHPADAEAWKKFDERYYDFAQDPRNVRLALASDGFSPYRQMSSAYSIWPVVLIPYNLPSWECMKQSSLILSMIIPGSKGPGNDIDVYLQPLIDELKTLWEGVPSYDATGEEGFLLRAALLWTIGDLPAYAILSGYSTKGRYACPYCGEETDSKWLLNGQKFCYMAHRRWLADTHKFRAETESFDGSEEWRHAPALLSGSDVLKKLEGHRFTYGKLSQATRKGKKRARHEHQEDIDLYDQNQDENLAELGSWKKNSIFFQLVYWEFNLLRHNIDVMHVGKNISENCVGTIMGDVWKTKDNLKARLDLVEMGIRRELHPETLPNGKVRLPPAIYSMSKGEKDMFCGVLKELKVPDGYASSISRCVNSKEGRLQGLKSHDYHILLQDILPVALRSTMSEQVTVILNELSSVYKGLCSRVLRLEDVDNLERRAIMTLCQLERIFPPSFFTISVHLIIHLAAEVRLGGPVHYRWMYPIERFIYTLKGYMKNRACPEASIAEGRLAEECSIFVSRYLLGVETRLSRPKRNPDISNLEAENYLFRIAGRTMGKIDTFELDDLTWEQAHRYVLDHHKSVDKFREEFVRTIKRRHRPRRLPPREQNKLMNEQFHKWFKSYVFNLGDENLESEVKILANGPHKIAKRYKGYIYIYNGLRFRTKDREVSMKSQNSGILVTSLTRSYASTKDTNPLDGDVDYYGQLTDIIDLDYFGHFRVVLFRGDWAAINKNGANNRDKLGFSIVDFSHLIHTGEHISHEPFVFPSQVHQVFYVKDPSALNSYVALKMQPRDGFQLGDNPDDLYDAATTNYTAAEFLSFDTNLHEHNNCPTWLRTDGSEGIILDDHTT